MTAHTFKENSLMAERNARPTRDAFGDGIVELARENSDIYVVDCDISKAMKTVAFAAAFPDRHINVGIAEQNAAGVAAGLAAMGKVAFLSTYAVFGSMRALEQIRTSACYPNLNVKVACSHGGITAGTDGVTHQGTEDCGIMRTMPNMAVIMGADYTATKKLLAKVAEWDGPCYIRFTKDEFPIHYGEDEPFEIGKGKLLKQGKDVTIISFGEMLHEALPAVDMLAAEGVDAELIDMHTLKPLDRDLVAASLARTGRVVTVEDHNWFNGLGSAVAEVIAETGHGVLRRIGLRDTFAESGRYDLLLKKYGMDRTAIAAAAKELLRL